MFKKIISFIQKFPFLKFLTNRYWLVGILFLVWMIFFDNTSFLVYNDLDKVHNELLDNKEYYQSEIKKDSQKIKELNDPMMTEKYAREKYYMKKDSEDIYIIEFEEDRVKDSILGADQ